MSEVVHFSSEPEVFAKADQLYREVAGQLSKLLPQAEVHHVGSTAIPGSLTKGDLDILVRVHRELFPDADAVLASQFARNTGSVRTEEFSAFQDSTTDPELGVQLVVIGSALDEFLAWRDRLEREPEIRRQYDELKRRFEGQSMDAYREAKSQFIAEHLGG